MLVKRLQDLYFRHVSSLQGALGFGAIGFCLYLAETIGTCEYKDDSPSHELLDSRKLIHGSVPLCCDTQQALRELHNLLVPPLSVPHKFNCRHRPVSGAARH